MLGFHRALEFSGRLIQHIILVMTILITLINLSIPALGKTLAYIKYIRFIFLRASKKVTEVTAGMIIRAADFSDFPVNASPFVKYLNDYLANLENSAIPAQLMTGQLDAIRQSKNMYVFLYICPIFV